MVKLGTGLLDKMVNGAFLGKRQMGRPLKYNIRTRGRAGWVEIIFNPRNKVEQKVGEVMRFFHPYLAFITYRFHVEKAREIGIRIDDFYMLKFHKEPYIMNHIYAQYFHPETLLERIRDVSFYRRPRTLFKGFRVPDWATAEKTHGWQHDAYSRTAWENAMAEFNSESTPMPFFGERQEPNPLQWFRLEQAGKGNSSRLYYNEVPKPWWNRHNGHLDNPEETLYSFTNADQEQQLTFGIDTTTEEGRIAYKKEYDALCEMVPEMIKQEDFQYPHEMSRFVSQEPHFQRLWKYYRGEHLTNLIDDAVSKGQVTDSDAAETKKFLGTRHHMSVNAYVMQKGGLRHDLAEDEGYLATDRVMRALGLDAIECGKHTAQTFEDQFWTTFDEHQSLSEVEMRKMMPLLVSDSQTRMRIESQAAHSEALLEAEETTEQLSA